VENLLYIFKHYEKLIQGTLQGMEGSYESYDFSDGNHCGLESPAVTLINTWLNSQHFCILPETHLVF